MSATEIRQLEQEIVEIARLGLLPDGDGVNVATQLWAESWWGKFDHYGYEAWLRNEQRLK